MRQILQGAQVDTLIVAELARRHISVILRKKRNSGDPLGEDQPCWFVEKSPIYETVSTCYMYIVYIIYTLIYIYIISIYIIKYNYIYIHHHDISTYKYQISITILPGHLTNSFDLSTMGAAVPKTHLDDLSDMLWWPQRFFRCEMG